MVAGFPVTIAVAMPGRLSRLSSRFQLIWASAWGRSGGGELGPLLGLPEDVPVIRFDLGADTALGTYTLRPFRPWFATGPSPGSMTNSARMSLRGQSNVIKPLCSSIRIHGSASPTPTSKSWFSSRVGLRTAEIELLGTAIDAGGDEAVA